MIAAIGNDGMKMLSATLPLPLNDESEWIDGQSPSIHDGLVIYASSSVVQKDGKALILVGGVKKDGFNQHETLIRKFSCHTLQDCFLSKAKQSLSKARSAAMVFMAPSWLQDQITCT